MARGEDARGEGVPGFVCRDLSFFLSTNERVDKFGQGAYNLLGGVLVCWAEELFLLNMIDLRELWEIF